MEFFPFIELNSQFPYGSDTNFLEIMIRVFNNLCSFFEDLLPMSFANLMNLSGQILKHHGTVLPDDTVIVLFEVMEKLKGRSERICHESINIVTKYLGNFIHKCNLGSRLKVFCKANICLQKLLTVEGALKKKTPLQNFHTGSNVIMKDCLRILQTTCANDVDICSGLLSYITCTMGNDYSKKDISLILTILEDVSQIHHQTDACAKESALILLKTILEIINDSGEFARDVSKDAQRWARWTYNILTPNIHIGPIVQNGSQILCYMTKLFMSSMRDLFGDDPKQIPIHQLATGMLFMYGMAPSLDVNACTAATELIYWLCMMNQDFQNLFVERNIQEALVFMMGNTDAKMSPQLTRATCLAFFGLSVQSQKNMATLVERKVHAFIAEAVLESGADTDLITVGMMALTNLMYFWPESDVKLIVCLQKLIFNVNWSSTMTDKQLCLLSNSILEFFHAQFLSEMSSPVVPKKLLMTTLEIMRTSKMKMDIQKKALILLQQLAVYLDMTHLISESIINVIKPLLRDFTKNNCMINEAIILLLFLEESSTIFRKTCVEMDVHICLFQTLFICKSSEIQVYEDVALRCLKLLVEDPSCALQILPSAAELLPLECVQCLILLDVPLQPLPGCESALVRASKKGRDDIVQYLLKKEVTEAEIKAAIKASIESGQNVITGILLKFFAHRQNSSNLVSWDSLGLKYLKIDWFEYLQYPNNDDIPELIVAHDLKAAILNSVTTKLDISQKGLITFHEKQTSPTNVDMIETIVNNLKLFPPLEFPDMTIKKQSHADRFLLHKLLPQTATATELESSGEDDVRNLKESKPGTAKPKRALLRRASEWVLGLNTNKAEADPLSRDFEVDVQEDETDIPITFDYTTDDVEEWCEMTISGCSYPCLNEDPRFVEKTFRNVFFKSFFLNRTEHRKKWRIQPAISTFIDISPHPMKCHHLNDGVLAKDILQISTNDVIEDCEEDDPPLGMSPTVTYNIDSSKAKSLKAVGSRNSYITFNTDSKKTLTRGSRSAKKTVGMPSGFSIINLSYNALEEIFDSEASTKQDLPMILKSLLRCELSYNKIHSIPPLFQGFDNLQVLDLEHNHLTTFPTETLHCAQLKSLNLSHNQIESIPFVNVHGPLEQIDLSHNKIEQFPVVFSLWFPRINKLDLSFNFIRSIPDDLPHFTKLKLFKLDANKVQTLPIDFFEKFNKLETLSLNTNLLEEIEHPNPESLLSLHNISAVENKLGPKFPSFFCKLPQLQTLNLSKNELASAPAPCKWKTMCLRELNLSHNELTIFLLDETKNWLSLENLNVSNNRIGRIPTEISQLVNLQSLDISYNGIQDLPEELGNCQNIWELNLRGLELNLDPILLKRGSKAVLKFLFDKLKQSDYHNRGRMIVVGPERSGKTSLIQTLTKKKHLHPASEIKNTGVTIKDWSFYRKSKASGQVTEHIISCWDFNGKEKYLQTIPCFFSSRALYLVVYNLSEGLNDTKKIIPWLLNIAAKAPGSPVIVVGTHAHSVENLALETEKFIHHVKGMCSTGGFPSISWITTVEASRENGILDGLRKEILDIFENFQVQKRPLIGEKVPRTQIILDNLMRRDSRSIKGPESVDFPVLHESDIWEKAQENGLDLDAEGFQEVMGYLNSLGTVLHFKDSNSRLNEYYFTDPEWLFSVVDEFLSLANESCGTLSYNELQHHYLQDLHSKHLRIRPEFFNQYIRIMTNFQVAIPLTKDEILIPSLLSSVCPPIKDDLLGIPKEKVVERVYCFPYQPTSFFSTFIIKVVTLKSALTDMNHDIGNVTYWKNGIHVFQEGQYSLHIEAHDKSKNKEDYFDVPEGKLAESQFAITICVTRSKPGTRALGYVIDLLDDFIDEHYPGLLAIDPVIQEPLLKIEIPCPECTEEGVKQRFNLNEILLESESSENILCPIHNGTLPIKLIAPDIVLWDVESSSAYSEEEVALSLKAENLLGDGGFGSVYNAYLNGKHMAVKVFKHCGEVHPHKLQRKEASIMQLLHHKNIVSLMGILTKPRCIILELAVHGSMADFLCPESQTLGMPIILSIIKDIALAMEYLHSKCVIYRDCKPDNILLFSLSLQADVNAKLSDYGISTMATSVGSQQQEGTPGYRAPECIKGESYSLPVDMFSLGITVFEMITKGRHPYSNYGLRSRAEYDDSVCKEKPFGLIAEFNSEPWPCMQDLLSQCLKFVPEDRPTASAFVSQVNSPSFFPLQYETSFDLEEYIENIVAIKNTQNIDDAVIITTKDRNQTYRLHSLSTTTFSKKLSITCKPDQVITCITSLKSDIVLLGTQDGSLLLTDLSNEHQQFVYKFSDSLLQLELIKEHSKVWMICGLANGCIFILYRHFENKLLKHDMAKATSEIHFVSNTGGLPILSFCMTEENLWYLVDETVSALNKTDLLSFKFSTTKSMELVTDTSKHQTKPKQLKYSKFIVDKEETFGLSYSRNDSKIHIWDLKELDLFKIIDIYDEMKSVDSYVDARIVGVLYHEQLDQLWVGTRGGRILVYEVSNDSVPFLCTLFRYDSPVQHWSTVVLGSGDEHQMETKTLLLCSTEKKSISDRRHELHGLVKDTESQGVLLAWNPEFIQKNN